MANEVEILLTAVDNASDEIKRVNGALGETEPASEAATFKMTELNAAMQVGRQVLAGLQQAYAATIVPTLAYADQVRELGQINGQTAESNSRLIQLLDDYKVSVGDLITSQRELNKDGKIMTTGFLAEVADKYQAATTQAEKNKVAQDNLGRSWRSYIEVLQAGGAAIRENSKNISENLLLTQKQVDAAREYQVVLDTWEEQLMKIQYLLGNLGLPALSASLKIVNADIEFFVFNAEKISRLNVFYLLANGTKAWADNLRDVRDTAAKIINDSGFYKSVSDNLNDVASAANNAAGATQTEAEAMQAAEAAAKAQADALNELTKINQGMIAMAGNFQAAEDSYTASAKTNAEERIKLEQERAAKIAQGYAATSDEIKLLDAQLVGNAQKAADNAAEHEKATNKILFGYLQQQLAIDGLTAGETEALLEQGKQWGIFSDASVTAMREAMAKADELAAKIDNLPSERAIHVALTVDEIYNANRVAATMGHKAAGGPVAPGQTYLVGERGPEILTMGSMGGNITPNNQLSSGGNISLSVNVSGGIIADPQEVGRQMVPALRYALRQLGITA